MPIANDNKCGHAKNNCKAGSVCAGPFSTETEWNWYKQNYVQTADSALYWDSEEWDDYDDVRFWDYDGLNAYQALEAA